MFVEKGQIGGVAGGTRGVAPERWYGRERHAADERLLVACVGDRKIQVRFRRHVQAARLDRTKRALDIAAEPWSRADIVPLPGSRLQDVVVGVGRKALAERLPHVLERRPRRRARFPQLAPPPLLRIEPPG